MRYVSRLLLSSGGLGGLAGIFMAAPLAFAADLSELRWSKRPLLIFADAGSQAFDMQMSQLADETDDMLERDMVIIHDDNLRRKYNIPSGAFAILLIGKDGGVKLRGTRPVQPSSIFALIDSMPMRMREMREPARSAK